jgi:hypothetical protein
LKTKDSLKVLENKMYSSISQKREKKNPQKNPKMIKEEKKEKKSKNYFKSSTIINTQKS